MNDTAVTPENAGVAAVAVKAPEAAAAAAAPVEKRTQARRESDKPPANAETTSHPCGY